MAPSKLPALVKVWPSMGLAAFHFKNRVGAWRLFVLARALDPAGSGHIQEQELRAAALALKINSRTYQAWLADALACGFFTRLRNGTIRLSSESAIFEILHCWPDKSRAEVKLKNLFTPGWRRLVWAAYIKVNHDNQLISQKKLFEITGIPPNSQKKLNQLVTRTRQFAITSKSPDQLSGISEYSSHGQAFVFVDPQQKNRKVVAMCLPSRQQVPAQIARTGGRGRLRTILANLRSQAKSARDNTLLFSRATRNLTILRLFYSTSKQERTALRIVNSFSRLPHDPREIFIHRTNRRGRRCFWDALPLGAVAN